jgi:hypothetical protein
MAGAQGTGLFFAKNKSQKNTRKVRAAALENLCNSLCGLRDNQQFGVTKWSLNAKTQRKTHAKSAQLDLETFAAPFVASASNSRFLGKKEIPNFGLNQNSG